MYRGSLFLSALTLTVFLGLRIGSTFLNIWCDVHANPRRSLENVLEQIEFTICLCTEIRYRYLQTPISSSYECTRSHSTSFTQTFDERWRIDSFFVESFTSIYANRSIVPKHLSRVRLHAGTGRICTTACDKVSESLEWRRPFLECENLFR